MRSRIATPLICALGFVVLARSEAALAADSSDPSRGSSGALDPDDREVLRASIDEAAHKRFLHGFRLGYLYVTGIHDHLGGDRSLAEKYGMRSPHQFLLGYEVTFRLVGHDWLNVLLVSNVMISGLEQSKVFPSANGLIGFEVGEAFQLGVGVNANPIQDKPAHMLIATGWTPRVGDFFTPIHAFFIPDVDGQHRMGITVGVNW